MAPTSEERREVAWRLRSEVSEGECIDYAVFRIINDVLGVNGAWGDKAARILADLIDPTCHVVPFDEESMRLPHCSRCGQPILKPWPNHCPNCGARVVSGDDQR